MEVKICFDTEREDINDLKRLVVALQDLISRREKASSLGNPLASSTITKPSQIKIESQQPKEEKKLDQATYSGHCRIVPYEDMSGEVSKIFSGKY